MELLCSICKRKLTSDKAALGYRALDTMPWCGHCKVNVVAIPDPLDADDGYAFHPEKT